ncbi:hypothetical protein [Labrys neptuniae]
MNKLILAGVIVMGGLYAAAGTAQAAPRHQSERYRYDEYARAECILPWYRFFGACDAAIQEPEGDKGHSWQHRHHRHGRRG